MPRLLLSLAVVVASPFILFAADPDPVERALAVQQALAAADDHLTADAPAKAVAALEAQLAHADGNRAYLDALRRAYAAELKQLEATPTADPVRAVQLRRKLGLLGGVTDPPAPAAAPVPEAPPAEADSVGEARVLFKEGKHAAAAARFAAAKGRAALTADDAAAWAFCRVRAAADAVNGPACDATTAATVAADVAEALQLAPANADLQKVGQAVLAVARVKADTGPKPAAAAVPADWEAIETASFRVRFQGTRAAAEAVAKEAEAKREETFKRWSGPAGGAWAPRCEIVLHPTAAAYAAATGKPAAGTGHATVRLAAGKATDRRIDLRADDPAAATNALPRELTHVVLADLFPFTPPPKWAEEGMAILAGAPDEVSRYVRTLPRCARDGELVAVAALLEMTDFPAAGKITGFYCESVTLVDYLVKLKGEQAFTLFLRGCHRYGTAKALKDQYGIDGPQALEAAWKRSALDVARGQTP